MIRLFAYTAIAALLGGIVAYRMSDGVPEGLITGAVIGASIGVIIGVRRNAGASGPAFELESAGIPDDNLITTARRNLVRDAYRDSYDESNIASENQSRDLASSDLRDRRR